MKSSTIINKLNSRLDYLSDHSKLVNARKSAKSALFVEMVIIILMYNYKDILRTCCLAMICLSIWHIFQMLRLLKSPNKEDSVSSKKKKKKQEPITERDVKTNHTIAILHGIWIALFIVVFIIK